MKELLDKWYNRSGQISPVRIPKLNRNRLIEHFAEYGLCYGAEIGVDRGRFSDRILKDIPDSRLLAIDIWHWRFRGESCYNSVVERFTEQNGFPAKVFMKCRACDALLIMDGTAPYQRRPRCFDCEPALENIPHETYRHLDVARRALRCASGQGIVMHMESMDAARLIEDDSLDFCYIDGDHRFDAVMMDLIGWARKVRPGGIVAGHDYYRFREAGIVPAVDVYTQQHGITRWFLTDEKNATFFWVRESDFVTAGYTR